MSRRQNDSGPVVVRQMVWELRPPADSSNAADRPDAPDTERHPRFAPLPYPRDSQPTSDGDSLHRPILYRRNPPVLSASTILFSRHSSIYDNGLVPGPF